MKNWKPLVFEDNFIPKLISIFAPIKVAAVSFAFFVFCRGKISETMRRHETIHYQQQLELLFVFQWLLYAIFYIFGLVKHRSSKKAYYLNPFEQEAYESQDKEDYLENRKRYSWKKYKI